MLPSQGSAQAGSSASPDTKHTAPAWRHRNSHWPSVRLTLAASVKGDAGTLYLQAKGEEGWMELGWDDAPTNSH